MTPGSNAPGREAGGPGQRLSRAAFLDRDGTLIRDAHFIRDPADVELLAGVPEALQRLRAAGFKLIVITNQSGIARGMMTEQDYEAVRARFEAELRAAGITLDASYHCPHHPDFTGPCECRKPGTLLHRRAADEHGVDLASSVFIGDRWRDVAPAAAFGATGILVPSPNTPDADTARATQDARVAKNLAEAVTLIVGSSRAR